MPVYRSILVACLCAFLLFFSAPALAGPCGEFIYLPDAAGKVKVNVTRGGYESYYLLTRQENSAFNRNLKEILDIILDQPFLKPPRGVELRGWLRNWHSPLCNKGPCRGVPINGQGILFFHFLFDSKGKAVPIIVTDNEMDFSINDPEAAIGSNRLLGQGGTDSQGRKITLQIPRLGEINGAAYHRQGRSELLVLSRSSKPLWLPVSREEALKAMIRQQEKEIAALGPISEMPHTDIFKKWLAEKPQRQKEAREMYRELSKSNPTAAEQIKQQSEKLESEMTERFRRDSEKEAARGPTVIKPVILDQRLARHREVLAGMGPEERAAPALFMRHGDPLEPELAPYNSSEGVPLIVVNPDFIDKSLPRTAIQLITIKYDAPWADPNWKDTCEGQNSSILLKYEVVNKTDWGKIIKLMK